MRCLTSSFKALWFPLIVFSCWSVAAAEDITFVGPWHTSRNIKLDGDLTCTVTTLGNDAWQGKFHGVWQGQPFEYTVKFAGKYDNLVGKAQIDGASYDWKGQITRDTFKGNFTGNRYTGYFDLKVKR